MCIRDSTFDGRSKEDIGDIAGSPELRRRCLEDVFDFEPLLPMCAAAGYDIVPGEPRLTRRKPLPDGDFLPLRLDWILLRGLKAEESRMVSTAKEDLTYARPGSCLLYTSRVSWGLPSVSGFTLRATVFYRP